MSEYLSLKSVDPTKIEIFDKWVDNPGGTTQTLHRVIGLINSKDIHTYHKYCNFNKFTIETYPVPLAIDGWKTSVESIKEDYDAEFSENQMTEPFESYLPKHLKSLEEWIKKYVCDPNAKIFQPDTKTLLTKYPNHKIYKTLNNYSIGFVVLISETNNVLVYGRTNDVIPSNYLDDDVDDIIFYNKLIKEYDALEVFIGTSQLNEMTNFSGGHGARFDGNSILLRIGKPTEFKYASIGCSLYEFATDELITTYASSVGNNCVPYPYAESATWAYCITGMQKTPISDHPNRHQLGTVFNVNSATYYELEYDEIAPYESCVRTSVLSNAETCEMRFLEPVEFSLCGQTCCDEYLPAVQYFNKVFN